MEKKLPIYELVLGDNGEWDGVYANSIVTEPAIKRAGVYMSAAKSKPVIMATEDGERSMFYGPVMIPDLMIYRKDDKRGEYYVTYTENTVRKCMMEYLKKGLQSQTTIEHMFPVRGVTMVECWAVENPELDKSVALGFDPFPKGTWMAGYHIEDASTRDMIKNGTLTGFSIEAWFDHVLVQMNEDLSIESFMRELDEIMKSEK